MWIPRARSAWSVSVSWTMYPDTSCLLRKGLLTVRLGGEYENQRTGCIKSSEITEICAQMGRRAMSRGTVCCFRFIQARVSELFTASNGERHAGLAVPDLKALHGFSNAHFHLPGDCSLAREPSRHSGGTEVCTVVQAGLQYRLLLSQPRKY